MALTAPVNVPGFTINDQRALDGLQWSVDYYNDNGRAAVAAATAAAIAAGEDPPQEWVDLTPLQYFRVRVLGWLHREAALHDPDISTQPEVLHRHIQRLRQRVAELEGGTP